MASMSNYLENKLIDFLFRGNPASLPAPTVIEVALCTAAPTDASTGATIAEVTGSGYQRTPLSPSTTNWAATDAPASTANPSAGTGGTTSNNSAITFPTATGNWSAQITHIALVDSHTIGAGNVLFWGALTVPKTVTNGDTLSFAISQLTCQIDN